MYKIACVEIASVGIASVEIASERAPGISKEDLLSLYREGEKRHREK